MVLEVKQRKLLAPSVMERSSDALAQVTLAYWLLSQAANGLGPSMTSGDAITKAQGLMKKLGPQRVLQERTSVLAHRLIMGNKRRKSKTAATISILKQVN